MPQFGMPKGCGVYGGANGKSSCYKPNGQLRTTRCNTFSRKCNTSNITRCERVSRATEDVSNGCKCSFMDVDSNLKVCGNRVIFVGLNGVETRIDDNSSSIVIDGLSLRKSFRQSLINIPPVPTSDNPTDFVLWKSQINDFLGGMYDVDECDRINNAIDYFFEVLSYKLDNSVEGSGDVWDNFMNSSDSVYFDLKSFISDPLSFKSQICVVF